MRAALWIVCSIFIGLAATACKSRVAETKPVTGSRVADVTPGAAEAARHGLDKEAVYQAMVDIRNTFYESSLIYSRPFADKDGSKIGPPPPSDVPECLKACPRYYSDIVCHYYCQFPSYKAVIPNIRGCFTEAVASYISKAQGGLIILTYPQAYDFCVYQDYDEVLQRRTAYDPDVIAANRRSDNKIGVMRWVDDNQPEIFKSIMFTYNNPFFYKLEDQQDVINRFYGVNLKNKSYTAADIDDVNECNRRRPARVATTYGDLDPIDGTHCSYLKAQPNLAVKP